ncbi:hypothetical protein SAMN06265337_1229 [Hymenobacter gelipurpurascens]|uniref:Uncharacterized protein n=1 Tax=Hymenobacter gelipurpurascens TaxID=89968 RepID=A0A212TGJ5_9BACT|nr:hypothetical protein SAMN06265337_1229 [Hymenobacter gelipurpurascens]
MDLINTLDPRTKVLLCATIEKEEIVALETCLTSPRDVPRWSGEWTRSDVLSFPELLALGETTARDKWWHMLLIANDLKDLSRRRYDRYGMREVTIPDLKEDLQRMYNFRQIRLRIMLAGTRTARV